MWSKGVSQPSIPKAETPLYEYASYTQANGTLKADNRLITS